MLNPTVGSSGRGHSEQLSTALVEVITGKGTLKTRDCLFSSFQTFTLLNLLCHLCWEKRQVCATGACCRLPWQLGESRGGRTQIHFAGKQLWRHSSASAGNTAAVLSCVRYNMWRCGKRLRGSTLPPPSCSTHTAVCKDHFHLFLTRARLSVSSNVSPKECNLFLLCLDLLSKH